MRWLQQLFSKRRSRTASLTRKFTSGIETLEQRRMLALTAELVSDINLNLPGVNINQMVTVGNTLYFTSDTLQSGRELWKTDGTSAGTQLVRDITPGPDSAYVGGLTNLNGQLIFFANDSAAGRELWTSDGTSSGTHVLADINPGTNSSVNYSPSMALIGNQAFFFANDGVHGRELWKTNGTSAGTQLVADINNGASSSSPTRLAEANGRIYFTANDGVNGRELWTSTGTSASTQMLTDLSTMVSSVDFGTIMPTGSSTTFFFANDDLYRTDGTSGGTSLVHNVDSANYFTDFATVNGILYFDGSEGATGAELWRTDGTSGGTFFVKDINPGGNSSDPYALTNFNGVLFFTAEDDTHGTELWKSDGTSSGTVLVNDLRTSSTYYGNNSSYPYRLTVADGRLFFAASGEGVGYELFSTDGTSSGTVIVRDIAPGEESGVGYSPVAFLNNQAYFLAADVSTTAGQLWRTDGTSAGTQLFYNFNSGYTAGSYPDALTPFAGQLYFTAESGVIGTEPWRTDGTASGTQLIADFNPGLSGTDLYESQEINGSLYFVGANDDGFALVKSNGSVAGTETLLALPPKPSFFSGGRSISQLTNVAGTVYFTAFDPTEGFQLWSTDGTSSGTQLVADVFPGMGAAGYGYDYPGPTNLFNYNGQLLFSAGNDADGVELWSSNGTSSGTVMVADINPDTGYTGYGYSSNPESFTLLNGKVYFTAETLAEGRELWSTDGTSSGTVLVADIAPGGYSGISGSNYSNLITLTRVGSQLFFAADGDDGNGTELWASNGTSTGTRLVADINPGSSSSRPVHGVEFANKLYFVADDDTHGRELWSSDGTSAGTQLVADIDTSFSAFSNYQRPDLTAVNGRLYFVADDGTHGREVWSTTGTSAGTVLVADINPGSASSYSYELTAALGTLFFTAYDPLHGIELRKVVTSGNTAPSLDISGDTKLGVIFQDEFDNNGTSIVDLLATGAGGSPITDPDSGALKGIAVTFADETFGVWDFSLDGGATWDPVGTVTSDAALLLSANVNTRLRFVPDATFNSGNPPTIRPEIMFRAWDQTSGSNGDLADTTTNGGETAFSTDVELATIIVTADTFLADGDTVYVQGTPTPDTFVFAFQSLTDIFLGLGGQSMNINPATINNIVFNGSGSTNTIFAFTNPSGAENAIVTPGGLSLNGGGYSLNLSNVSTLVLFGDANDSVTYQGSSTDDVFYAFPSYSQIASGNLVTAVFGFGTTVIENTGGFDAAILVDSAGDDTFTAEPGSATMSGAAFSYSVSGFNQIYGFAVNGGNDSAVLTGSTGGDLAYGLKGFSVLADNTLSQYLLEAIEFDSVIINGNNGTDFDLAVIFDSVDNDTLVDDNTGVTVASPNYSVQINAFDFYYAIASGGGTNNVTLNDSAGQDIILANSFPVGEPNSTDHALYLTSGVVYELYNWSAITANDSGTDADIDLFDDDAYDFALTLNGRWIPAEI